MLSGPPVSDAETDACPLAELPNGPHESPLCEDELESCLESCIGVRAKGDEVVLAPEALKKAIGKFGEQTRTRLSIRNLRGGPGIPHYLWGRCANFGKPDHRSWIWSEGERVGKQSRRSAPRGLRRRRASTKCGCTFRVSFRVVGAALSGATTRWRVVTLCLRHSARCSRPPPTTRPGAHQPATLPPASTQVPTEPVRPKKRARVARRSYLII